MTTDTKRTDDDVRERFPLGARVTDVEQDEENFAYVVGHGGPADEYRIGLLDDDDDAEATVASVNREYDPDEPVVEVVFEDTLDAYVPYWEQHAGATSLPWHITEMSAAWNLPPVSRYGYPAARLEPVPFDGEDGPVG